MKCFTRCNLWFHRKSFFTTVSRNSRVYISLVDSQMGLARGWWFSPVSFTNKTDCQDITEILLKVELNTINQPKPVVKGNCCNPRKITLSFTNITTISYSYFKYCAIYILFLLCNMFVVASSINLFYRISILTSFKLTNLGNYLLDDLIEAPWRLWFHFFYFSDGN